ncbi:hypothetical protein AB0D57_44365 [Streptomyces sp. NPDC048275]
MPARARQELSAESGAKGRFYGWAVIDFSATLLGSCWYDATAAPAH